MEDTNRVTPKKSPSIKLSQDKIILNDIDDLMDDKYERILESNDKDK